MSRDYSLVFKVGERVTKLVAGFATELYVWLCRYYITITRLMQHQCVCLCEREGRVCVLLNMLLASL